MHAGSQECTFPCSCVLESSLETLLESSVRRFSWVLFFRHAWLNLLSEHISAGRINQVSWPNRDSSSKYRGFSREHTQTFHTRNRAVFEIFTQNHTFLKNGRDFVCARETAEDSCIKNFCKKFFYSNFLECTKNGRDFVCARKTAEDSCMKNFCKKFFTRIFSSARKTAEDLCVRDETAGDSCMTPAAEPQLGTMSRNFQNVYCGRAET